MNVNQNLISRLKLTASTGDGSTVVITTSANTRRITYVDMFTWVGADERLVQLPFRDARIECSHKHHHADGDEGGENSIEHRVEESDLGCKE